MYPHLFSEISIHRWAGLAADGLDGAKHTDSHVPQRDLLPLINPPMAEWVVDHLPGTPLTVWCVGCTMTAGSMAACIPLIYLLKR
jgi:hypothetical protein